MRVLLLCVSLCVGVLSPRTNNGCHNDGNSCFMNATIQALYHVQSFHDFLLYATQADWYMPGAPVFTLKQHISELKKAPVQMHVRDFRDAFCTQFGMGGYGQHDAAEFLQRVQLAFTERLRILNELEIRIDELRATLKKQVFPLANSLSPRAKVVLTLIEEHLYASFLDTPQLYLFITQLLNPEALSSTDKLFFEELIDYYERIFWAKFGFKKKPTEPIISKGERTIIFNQLVASKQQLGRLISSFKVSSFFNKFAKSLGTNFLTFREAHAFIQACRDQSDSDWQQSLKALLEVFKSDNRYLTMNEIEQFTIHAHMSDLLPLITTYVTVVQSIQEFFFIEQRSHTYLDAQQSMLNGVLTMNLFPISMKKGIYSLQQALNYELKRDEDNKPSDVGERLTLHALPTLLIFHLKRFEAKERIARKNNDPLTFPLDFDMTPYVHQDYRGNTQYKLRSIVVHNGILGGGHYWAYCYDGIIAGGAATHKWYKHDDIEQFQMVDMSKEVATIAATGLDGGATPYLLLYEKIEQQPVVAELKKTRSVLLYLKDKLLDLFHELKELVRKLSVRQ